MRNMNPFPAVTLVLLGLLDSRSIAAFVATPVSQTSPFVTTSTRHYYLAATSNNNKPLEFDADDKKKRMQQDMEKFGPTPESVFGMLFADVDGANSNGEDKNMKMMKELMNQQPEAGEKWKDFMQGMKDIQQQKQQQMMKQTSAANACKCFRCWFHIKSCFKRSKNCHPQQIRFL